MSNLVYHKELEGYVKPPQPPAPCKPEPKPLCQLLATAKVAVEALRACTKCKGDGHTLSEGYSYDREDGTRRNVPTEWKPCIYCNGRGWFHAPDLEAIILKVKGRKPRSLKSKRPEDARSYFVWRMARFHGGADVCMPMAASMDIAGDPYEDILDGLASLIAKAYFGSSNVGAARWQQAFYGSHSFKDLPQSLDGPTYDRNKPESEYLETV